MSNVLGLGMRAEVLGVWVSSLGFRVSGFGFRVSGWEVIAPLRRVINVNFSATSVSSEMLYESIPPVQGSRFGA